MASPSDRLQVFVGCEMAGGSVSTGHPTAGGGRLAGREPPETWYADQASPRAGPMMRADRVASLEEAKAQFQKSWDAWKTWAKLEEVL
jgi:hypothetical protein